VHFVRPIQAHSCIQNFAGQTQIFFPRKETKSHFLKKIGFNIPFFKKNRVLKSAFHHFTCFALLTLRGINDLEGLSAEEENLHSRILGDQVGTVFPARP
jgi:hypothetical protein